MRKSVASSLHGAGQKYCPLLQLWSEPAQNRAVLSVNPELNCSLTTASWLVRLLLLLPMGTVEPALLAQVITLIA